MLPHHKLSTNIIAISIPGWTKSDSRASAIGVGSVTCIGFMSAFVALILLLDIYNLKVMVKGVCRRIRRMTPSKITQDPQNNWNDEGGPDMLVMNDLN